MAKPKLIIDCDPGHDDAVALILGHAVADVLGVTTVSGNAALADVTRNALAILELLAVDTPVHAGAARPLAGEARHAAAVHGPGGLGGVQLEAPRRTVASDDAVAFIIDTVRDEDGVWLVAIGPLTNIALALQRAPDIARRVTGISLMGGSTTVGNVTAVAEFNVWADPEAADVVLRSGAPLRMCGLNLTHQLRTDDALCKTLRTEGGPLAGFVADLFAFLHQRMADLIGERSSALHDPCAVLAVVEPGLFEFAWRPVEVELRGTLTRGMTVVDERPRPRRGGAETAGANVAVAYRIDAETAMRRVLEAVRAFE